MAVEIFMAKMSDHMEAGEIVSWLVQEGDFVEKGQPILEVMTDKAVAEVVAEATGVLKGIQPGAVEGAMVPVGETIAFIAAPDETVPALPPRESVQATFTGKTPPPLRLPATGPMAEQPDQVRATPIARRIAKDLGIELACVTGTGPGGRIREEDVHAFAEAREPALAKATGGVSVTPDAATAQPGAETGEWLNLSTIQRRTGQRMLESVQQAPQFALTTDVDMTQALRLRETLMERIVATTGERLSMTAILVKVVAAALESHPRTNASFQDGRVRLHSQRNIGVAVGTEDGLVVPVIKEADRKSLARIAQELKSFQEKALQMRLSTEDLAGGTFTISNLGMYGIDRFNAIVNPPQSAILAVGRIIKTPVGMPDDTIALRPMMSLTLTVDHRSMDGVQGARFLAEVKARLEEPFLLL